MPSKTRRALAALLLTLGAVALAQPADAKGRKAKAAAPALSLHSTVQNVVRGEISAERAPVMRIRSGDTVKIDTISHGGLQDDPVAFFATAGISKDQVLADAIAVAKATKEKGWSGHVLTGPIYVEGAEAGDMLEVRIIKVEPRVPYGVNTAGPGGVAPGLLTERTPKIIKYDMKRRVALFSKDIEIPLGPFMGIMAVAPPPEVKKVGSRAPGAFGGNMDFNKLTDGATLYLPVFNPGALFYTGDSHGAQGDGEVDGNAIEASMAPTLQFIVHKGAGKAMSGPRAEDASNFYILGLDTDLDVAMKNAVANTVAFLHEKMGLSVADAYSLCSTAVDFGVAEAVDQTLVIYGKIPKRLFKHPPAYWAKK
jgi:acetamidase/formamidase